MVSFVATGSAPQIPDVSPSARDFGGAQEHREATEAELGEDRAPFRRTCRLGAREEEEETEPQRVHSMPK